MIIATVSVCVGRLYSDLPYYIIGLGLGIYNLQAWAGCVAYPWEEAMREPECRDGRK